MATDVPVVWMVNPSGGIAGGILYRSLTAVPRYCDVGTWTVTCPLTEETVQAADRGWRIAIRDKQGTVIAGPVTKAEITIGQDESGNRMVPQLVLSGVDDMTWLDGRTAWPTPGAAITAQTDAYDIRTGTASTIIRQYVDVNAGPGALTAREVSGLVLGADPAVGATITGRARFDNLLEFLRGLGVSGGVGFRVDSDTSNAKTFEVFTPTDLRGPARFSVGLRNLRRIKWSLTAPTATTIIGGGRGEETARDFLAVANSTQESDWGRREGFYDYRSASDSDGGAELTQGATKRLEEQTATQQAELLPVDTSLLRYGQHYQLGDQVTVGVFGGIEMDGVVREVEITCQRGTNGALRRTRPRIGDIGTTATSRQWLAIRDALARIRNLERR